MAQVTTADIRTRIKNMLGAMPVISAFTPTVYIFDKAPLALPLDVLPALVITESNGTYARQNVGSRFIKTSRAYTITLYMQEWSTDPTLNIQEGGIDALTTAIEDCFTTYAPLNYMGSDLKGVSDAYLSTISGIAPRNYPEVQGAPVYVSIRWALQVIYTRKI